MKVVMSKTCLLRISKRITSSLVFVPCLLLSALPSFAATVTLDFNSLPSTQGWTYSASGNSVPEANVFSVSEDTLLQNTIGVGFAGQGANFYELLDVVDPLLPFTLEVRARVLSEEGDVSNNSFGFASTVFMGTERFGFGLGTNRIQDILGNELSTTIDNTQFHDYVLKGTPGVGYEFFVDNVLLATGTPRSASFNRLSIGDHTGGTNARAEVTHYRFTQSEPVPEPSTLLGILAVLGFGAAMKQK